jgi:hypothetical protein
VFDLSQSPVGSHQRKITSADCQTELQSQVLQWTGPTFLAGMPSMQAPQFKRLPPYRIIFLYFLINFAAVLALP